MTWRKSNKKETLVVECTDVMHANSAREIRERFEGESWFSTAYAGVYSDGSDIINEPVIYIQTNTNRFSERINLYMHKGYPVLMRNLANRPDSAKRDDDCDSMVCPPRFKSMTGYES